jgi:hypothetical protein
MRGEEVESTSGADLKQRRMVLFVGLRIVKMEYCEEQVAVEGSNAWK